jgi:hypothetical protein
MSAFTNRITACVMFLFAGHMLYEAWVGVDPIAFAFALFSTLGGFVFLAAANTSPTSANQIETKKPE